MDERVVIESYYHQSISVAKIVTYLNRIRIPIDNVIKFFKAGHTAFEYYLRNKENKKQCGRKKTILPQEQQLYIKEKVAEGWTPDVIIGRKERTIDCSVRMLYRQFKEKIFGETTLL